jgi:hypothetical protein
MGLDMSSIADFLSNLVFGIPEVDEIVSTIASKWRGRMPGKKNIADRTRKVRIHA